MWLIHTVVALSAVAQPRPYAEGGKMDFCRLVFEKGCEGPWTGNRLHHDAVAA
jgi:hypothetical protein